MLLLTNCEFHTGKYLDRSFEVRTEQSEVRTKNKGPNILPSLNSELDILVLASLNATVGREIFPVPLSHLK